MFFCATYHTMRTALRAQRIARCRAPSPAGCDATASPFDQWSNSGQSWWSKIVVKKVQDINQTTVKDSGEKVQDGNQTAVKDSGQTAVKDSGQCMARRRMIPA